MDERTIARFWPKVDRSAGPDGCWLWTAAKLFGYGVFTVGRKTMKAHRVAWELTNGPIPDGPGYHGTCVCHRCDVRACVNPSHMFLGTQGENMADRDAKGRQARQQGETHGGAKLSAEQVASMRSDRTAGMLLRELAAKYGVSESQAHRIVTGKRWAHV